MKNSNSLDAAAAGLSRRKFIQRAGWAAGGVALSFPYVGNVLGANDRINLACIGCGGKGAGDTTAAAKCGANIVALCDVDERMLDKKRQQFAEKFPDLKRFRDYRDMLDKIGKDIDAVTISIPDHNHGVAAIRAMTMGKHCFCQKPLTQTVNEARIVRRLAKEKNLATQMGNQGSAENGLRRAVEVIQAGVIGHASELHVWSNRPIWPQGLERPPGSDVVPATLDWNVWLGPAPERPYKGPSVKGSSRGVYNPFNWRGWFDFGTGALGDMACHTVNMPFRGLKLGYPNVVECELASRIYSETYPKTSRIRFEFPEREGLPSLKFWWYDGNPDDALKPLRPDTGTLRKVLGMADSLPRSGALIIGEKGQLFSPDDYGAKFFIAMNDQNDFIPGDEHPACRAVPQTIPRSPGHMEEWFRMMKDGTPAYSNFDIAAYLAEVILLGCVALRLGEGQRMEWDGPGMRSPNLPEAARFIKRENRAGWEA
ncbi:MAG TPA: Gfo/Idh/MocA family oxidoreductase [Candidatus Saccharimonadales bacterium]|nr:Gfo/Idh/MocA family oxidoreductase [Candidatus Saccharimonadales bacterium]